MNIRNRLLIRKSFSRKIVTFVSIFAILIANLNSGAAFAAGSPSIYDYYSQNGVMFYSANTKGCSSGTNSGSDATTSAGTGGDWTDPNTPAGKNAKEIFDYWIGKGFSAAAAAGVLGNVYTESWHTFNPMKLQGDATSTSPNPSDAGENGYGLYQFTPGSKYSGWSGYQGPVSNSQASIINEGDFVIASEASTIAPIAIMTDPGVAAKAWEADYERPKSTSDADERAANAVAAYNAFAGSSPAAPDPSKIAEWSGGSGGSSTTGSSSSSSSSSGCSSGGGGAGQTGQVNASSKAGQAISWIENSANWNSTTDIGNPGINVSGQPIGAQCYELGVAYVNQITGHSGGIFDTPGNASNLPGNMQASGQFSDWTYVSNPTLSQLSIGAVESESAPDTAVIVSISGNDVTFLQQNYGSPALHTITEPSSGPALGMVGTPILTIAIPPASALK